MIKLYAKINDIHDFACFYMILSNLSEMILTAKNNFSHFSLAASLFGKSFSIPFHSFPGVRIWNFCVKLFHCRLSLITIRT